MKNKLFYYIFSLLTLSAVFSNCSDDEKTPVLTGFEASRLNYLPSNSLVLEVPEKGTNPLLFAVTWTETFFFLDGSDKPFPVGPVTYSLQLDKEGNGFADAKILTASPELYTNLLTVDLNAFLLKQLSAIPGSAINYEMRIVASYGAGNPDQEVPSANVLPITITAYNPPVEVEPVYIIGDMQGWDNNKKEFMMYRNSSDPMDMVYTYTGWINSNTYFKFCPESGLGSWSKMYCMGAGGVLEFGDLTAFHIETEGYYTLTIDVGAMTWSIENYDASGAVEWEIINFVGAFCDWGGANEPDMVRSTYDPHQWVLDVTLDNIDYGVKFRANHSWDNRWCPSDPKANPYGISEYNPSHDNNIDISGQGLGTYHVRFNDLTGHHIVALQ
jgi:hypothetical protein